MRSDELSEVARHLRLTMQARENKLRGLWLGAGTGASFPSQDSEAVQGVLRFLDQRIADLRAKHDALLSADKDAPIEADPRDAW